MIGDTKFVKMIHLEKDINDQHRLIITDGEGKEWALVDENTVHGFVTKIEEKKKSFYFQDKNDSPAKASYYITTELVQIPKLTYSHPKVLRIWEWGAFATVPTSGEPFRKIGILLKDGSRHEFSDDGGEDSLALARAQDFVCNLPLE